MKESPFHQGELTIQEKVGEAYIAKRVGMGIQDVIPTMALRFIDKQPMVFVSSRDLQGNIWLSVLIGKDGFIKVDSEKQLTLDLAYLESEKSDTFWENIKDNPQIGMLFIETATRRRLRVNGITSQVKNQVIITVQQGYANCPKFIQAREVEVHQKNRKNEVITTSGNILNDSLKQFITKADTFFVGSGDAEGNLDASHRGGKPGFVQVLDEKTLKIPDYPGNSMYNTLGNFVTNPNTGLLFVDFENGKTLQLVGKAKVLLNESEETNEETLGTKRFWTFEVETWKESDNLQNLEWKFIDYSQFNPA